MALSNCLLLIIAALRADPMLTVAPESAGVCWARVCWARAKSGSVNTASGSSNSNAYAWLALILSTRRVPAGVHPRTMRALGSAILATTFAATIATRFVATILCSARAVKCAAGTQRQKRKRKRVRQTLKAGLSLKLVCAPLHMNALFSTRIVVFYN